MRARHGHLRPEGGAVQINYWLVESGDAMVDDDGTCGRCDMAREKISLACARGNKILRAVASTSHSATMHIHLCRLLSDQTTGLATSTSSASPVVVFTYSHHNAGTTIEIIRAIFPCPPSVDVLVLAASRTCRSLMSTTRHGPGLGLPPTDEVRSPPVPT